MSNFLTALIFGIGVGAWVYNKAQRRSGGLTQQSLIVGGIVGFIAWLVFFTLIGILTSAIS